jgi:Pectate lyase superfamily protein
LASLPHFQKDNYLGRARSVSVALLMFFWSVVVSSVPYTTASAMDSVLHVNSDVSFKHSIELKGSFDWKASPVNQVLDRSAALDMWVEPIAESLAALHTATDRLGKFPAFGAEGNSIASSGTGAEDGLREDVAASEGAALVGLLQAGTGAVGPTAQDKMRDLVNVKDFGAIGDGVADDIAAMQAAHNTSRIVYYPQGTYKFSGQLTIAAGGIIGAGKTLTNLNAVDTSTNAAIKFTGPYTTLQGGLVSGNAKFQDFTLNGNALKTTGAGLQFNSVTQEASYADLRGLQISYFPINVDFVNASLWKMIGCDILGHTVAGIRVNNTFENDAGDSLIMGNNIITSSKTAAQILHISSGGLKIIGNKLLGGRDGYLMQYMGRNETSNLIISNNSIENFSGQAIKLNKVSGGLPTFRNIIISGNQISVSLATPSASLIENDGGAWLQSVTITGNVFQLPGVTNSFGIALTGVTALMIQGNTFKGNGGTSLAIVLTSCVDAKIGTNVYSNITTPYSLITPGANNSVALDSQSGAAMTSDVGWTSYYGLYRSTATTVIFAQPFQITPQLSDISFSLATFDGSISAIVVSISKTQLQFAVVAARTPGFVASINWKVRGVL